MQRNHGRLRQFNLFLGAILLVSSSFSTPIAASAGNQNTVTRFFVGSNALPPLPIQLSGVPLLPGRGPSQFSALISGDGGASVPPMPVISADQHFASLLSPQAIQELPGPSVVAEAAENSPALTGQYVQVSVKNSIFGSSASVSSASGSGELQGMASSSSGNVKEAQTFIYRTGGEAPNTFFEASTSGGPNTLQIVLISNPSISGLQSYSSTASLTSVTSAIPGLWLDSSKRRSRSQIHVEILELMKRGPMTPFEIAFYARLNHKRTKEYVEFLRRNGYLDVVVEDGRLSYALTKNGIIFLEGVKSLFENNGTPTEYVKSDSTQTTGKFV
jgi:predicted transcriptional regulator